ncbi:TIGR01777 family protein [Undibacterium parvum]|uniref:TIGR01777 family protein n=1 Tax=Undibacterium parvum TaxID=401471 RepID=A0A3Q9BNV8_9BURK|nr:TIGR01777 family protein [Undibacterium parvum]
MTEALPQPRSARLELSIHSVRALIYSLLFIGLAGWLWHGLWALLLLLIFALEIVLTLWDFVIEDRSRLLPASERITHTVLAINGGAFIMLLILNVPVWMVQTSMLQAQDWSGLTIFLALCGVGVGLSGIRDALAAQRLYQQEDRNNDQTNEATSMLNTLHFNHQSASVLVTGATGFIGQQLVRALIADGQRVTVLSRNPKQAAWLFDAKVSCIGSMGELPDAYPLDVIINLAGARILGWRWSEKRKAELRLSRVALTDSIVAWIARANQKPRLLLSASAIGYYGIQEPDDQRELAEDSPPQPIFMSQLCQEWEAAAQAAQQYGVHVKCMRFGLVLGQQGALPMMLLPIKLGLGGALGRGSQCLSWIHVDDVVRGIAHLCAIDQQADVESRQDGAYNFCAPESLTQKQFSQTAARILGRPCFMPTPAWPMRLALGEQADLLLEGQRVIPRRLQAQGFRFAYPDLESALKNLLK